MKEKTYSQLYIDYASRYNKCMCLKGGYLDFLHLPELKKNIYITEIYLEKKKKNTNHQ